MLSADSQMAVVAALAVAFLIYRLLLAPPAFTVDQIPDLQGRTAIITGANSGLGLASAKAMAAKGCRIIMACRSEDRAKAAIKEIKQSVPNADVVFMKLNLADWDSVQAFAQAFKNTGFPLHILMNNAGIMAPPQFEASKHGVELQMAGNHLGHFYLTHLLLPVLEKTARANPNDSIRIVNLSSLGHWFTPLKGIDFKHINDPSAYNAWLWYGQSKLANLLFSNQLQKRINTSTGLTNVYVNAVHPGAVSTNLATNSAYISTLAALGLMEVIGLSPANGALTQLYCATSGEIVLKGFKGRYFVPTAAVQFSSFHGRDEKLAEELWDWSVDVLSKQGNRGSSSLDLIILQTSCMINSKALNIIVAVVITFTLTLFLSQQGSFSTQDKPAPIQHFPVTSAAVNRTQIHPNDREALIAAGCFIDPLTYKPEVKKNSPLPDSSFEAWERIDGSCAAMTSDVLAGCPIPNVYHGVFGDNMEFKFHHYVSLKSVHDIVQPFAMYIHGFDFPMKSALFQKAIKEFDLILVPSRRASQVFHIDIKVKEHESDALRMEIMNVYGGIYADFDVFWLKPLHNLGRFDQSLTLPEAMPPKRSLLDGHYETVLGEEEPDLGVGNGILINKRCARFMMDWYMRYNTFDDNDWRFHSVLLPMIMWKTVYHAGVPHGDLLHVEVDTLQKPDWSKRDWVHTKEGFTNWDWTKNYACHLWYRAYGKKHNFDTIKTADDPIGRMARYILWGDKTKGFQNNDDYFNICINSRCLSIFVGMSIMFTFAFSLASYQGVTVAPMPLIAPVPTLQTNRIPIHPNDREALIAAGCFIDPLTYKPEVKQNSALPDSSFEAWDRIDKSCAAVTSDVLAGCPIPNVYHGVFGDNMEFKFHHYVSLKSMHDIVQPFAMYIHGFDFPMKSALFQKAIKEFDLILVPSRRASQVFHIDIKVKEHESDVLRMEIMNVYGGIYADFDVFWLKPLHNLGRFNQSTTLPKAMPPKKSLLDGHYETVLGEEEPDLGVGNGILINKRCARFMMDWYTRYNTFNDEDWRFHSVLLPMIMWKTVYRTDLPRGDLLHVEVDTLQKPDWSKRDWVHTKEGFTNWDWTKNYACHLWYRAYGKKHNFDTIKTADDPIGRMARYILWGDKTKGFQNNEDYFHIW
ncbi:hypothetical protein HDU98_002168 [Podochytrium sp. JEL0797]|nr:hypothetical protein HDU98_002168 [Podochytrium sp. JEL0797]